MIVVSAATGQLGRLFVQQLLERVPATEVAVAMRNPDRAADLAARGVAAARRPALVSESSRHPHPCSSGPEVSGVLVVAVTLFRLLGMFRSSSPPAREALTWCRSMRGTNGTPTSTRALPRVDVDVGPSSRGFDRQDGAIGLEKNPLGVASEQQLADCGAVSQPDDDQFGVGLLRRPDEFVAGLEARRWVHP